MKKTTLAEIKKRLLKEEALKPKPLTKKEKSRAFTNRVLAYQKSKVKAIKRTNNEYYDKYGELINEV